MTRRKKTKVPLVPAGPVRERADLIVQYWPLERITPDERNARTHSDAQLTEIAASIHGFGFTNPVLVTPEGVLIAGHGRLAAGRLLKLQTVPVIVLAGLNDADRRQLMLADNRIALNAGWDAELLRLELRDLAELGANLKILGFSDSELSAALTGAQGGGLTDEDDIPDSDDGPPVSRPGDLWCLGRHRVICGDCTDPQTVAKLLQDARPNLMVTDPPYGVEYDPTWRHARGVSSSNRTGKVLNDERADWREAWALFPGHIAYVWHAALHSMSVADSLVGEGFNLRAQIIWAKERLVIGRGDYHWQHEPCWYAVREKGHWTGDRKQTTLWTISDKNQDAKTIHGTQKPVECMRRPIANNSAPGEVIYEPFLGSGTTLIAAQSSGRVCYAVELNPVYVGVAIRRWQAFTGEQARIDGDGWRFDDIAARRANEVGDCIEASPNEEI